MIGAKRCCARAACTAKTRKATTAASRRAARPTGATPLIHIIVVVVSPITLPAPPALAAATIAAR